MLLVVEPGGTTHQHQHQLVWRLSGNLIYNPFSIPFQDNLRTDFTLKSPEKYQTIILQTVSIQSPY